MKERTHDEYSLWSCGGSAAHDDNVTDAGEHDDVIDAQHDRPDQRELLTAAFPQVPEPEREKVMVWP